MFSSFNSYENQILDLKPIKKGQGYLELELELTNDYDIETLCSQLYPLSEQLKLIIQDNNHNNKESDIEKLKTIIKKIDSKIQIYLFTQHNNRLDLNGFSPNAIYSSASILKYKIDAITLLAIEKKKLTFFIKKNYFKPNLFAENYPEFNINFNFMYENMEKEKQLIILFLLINKCQDNLHKLPKPIAMTILSMVEAVLLPEKKVIQKDNNNEKKCQIC